MSFVIQLFRKVFHFNKREERKKRYYLNDGHDLVTIFRDCYIVSSPGQKDKVILWNN